MQRHIVDVEDTTLLCFEAFKNFSVLCDVEDFQPTKKMMSFWARPSMARTQQPEISETEEMYGKEGDADSEVEEDLIQPTTIFKAMQQPKKDTSIPSGGFRYDMHAVLAASMQDGAMHEWVLCEHRAVCRTYGLSVRGTKANVSKASNYYALLSTQLVDRLITKLVGVNNLKRFSVGLYVCAMDCHPRQCGGILKESHCPTLPSSVGVQKESHHPLLPCTFKVDQRSQSANYSRAASQCVLPVIMLHRGDGLKEVRLGLVPGDVALYRLCPLPLSIVALHSTISIVH